MSVHYVGFDAECPSPFCMSVSMMHVHIFVHGAGLCPLRCSNLKKKKKSPESLARLCSGLILKNIFVLLAAEFLYDKVIEMYVQESELPSITE
jgi:hypothetical protein